MDGGFNMDIPFYVLAAVSVTLSIVSIVLSVKKIREQRKDGKK